MLLAVYCNAPDHTESVFCFSIAVMSSAFIVVRETHQPQNVCSRVNIVVMNFHQVFHVQNAYNKLLQPTVYAVSLVCMVAALPFVAYKRHRIHCG